MKIFESWSVFLIRLQQIKLKILQFWDTLKSAALGAVKGVIGQELEKRGLSAEEIKAREDGVCSVIKNCSGTFAFAL